MVSVSAYNETSLRQAASIIQRGGVVAFPTETVYGLGADAFNPRAVARVFEIKRRPQFDPLIVHIARKSDLENLVQGVTPLASKLVEAFWPGPLTLVLPKRDIIPGIVTSGLPSVAIRMPAHPVALRLIELCERPLAAPSANLFGHVSPTRAEHVQEQLGEKVDLILDGGPCNVGVESTIVSLTPGDQPEVLRLGGVTIEEIEQIAGQVRIRDPEEGPALAPGMLSRHYSPRTPLKILDNYGEIPSYEGRRIGLLAFKSPPDRSCYHAVEVLSESGDLREAAANLFAALHRLDAAGLDLILAEPVPQTGIGLAIMDRLKRASGSFGGEEG